MKSLLCEGACNPLMPDIQQRIAEFQGFERRSFLAANLYGGCRYTPHEETKEEFFFRCVECGHRRRFGSSRVSVGREGSEWHAEALPTVGNRS